MRLEGSWLVGTSEEYGGACLGAAHAVDDVLNVERVSGQANEDCLITYRRDITFNHRRHQSGQT